MQKGSRRKGAGYQQTRERGAAHTRSGPRGSTQTLQAQQAAHAAPQGHPPRKRPLHVPCTALPRWGAETPAPVPQGACLRFPTAGTRHAPGGREDGSTPERLRAEASIRSKSSVPTWRAARPGRSAAATAEATTPGRGSVCGRGPERRTIIEVRWFVRVAARVWDEISR